MFIDQFVFLLYPVLNHLTRFAACCVLALTVETFVMAGVSDGAGVVCVVGSCASETSRALELAVAGVVTEAEAFKTLIRVFSEIPFRYFQRAVIYLNPSFVYNFVVSIQIRCGSFNGSKRFVRAFFSHSS